MGKTRKDGRRGGAHRSNRGMEWQSKRGPRGWKDAGPWMKRLTHRMERRLSRFLTFYEIGFDLPSRGQRALFSSEDAPDGE